MWIKDFDLCNLYRNGKFESETEIYTALVN